LGLIALQIEKPSRQIINHSPSGLFFLGEDPLKKYRSKRLTNQHPAYGQVLAMPFNPDDLPLPSGITSKVVTIYEIESRLGKRQIEPGDIFVNYPTEGGHMTNSINAMDPEFFHEIYEPFDPESHGVWYADILKPGDKLPKVRK
jgi:hypothetical protein